MSTHELVVVGGPNGAGKTTFAEGYAARIEVEYVGADAIAQEMSPDNPAVAKITAGREFRRRIEEAISGAESCIVESILSGQKIQHVLTRARSAGFLSTLVYLFLDSPDTCVSRVMERVQKGGHDVPELDIRRRFVRSMRNFWNRYRNMSDNWLLLYNASEEPQDVAVGTPTHLSIRDTELFSKFQLLLEADD